jgi:hypothetical protein
VRRTSAAEQLGLCASRHVHKQRLWLAASLFCCGLSRASAPPPRPPRPQPHPLTPSPHHARTKPRPPTRTPKGPYSSRDPAVIQRHVADLLDAGVTAIVSGLGVRPGEGRGRFWAHCGVCLLRARGVAVDREPPPACAATAGSRPLTPGCGDAPRRALAAPLLCPFRSPPGGAPRGGAARPTPRCCLRRRAAAAGQGRLLRSHAPRGPPGRRGKPAAARAPGLAQDACPGSRLRAAARRLCLPLTAPPANARASTRTRFWGR